MSKGLRMIDFRDLLTWEHDEWLQIQIEQEMKNQEELEDENGWDEEQDEYGDDSEFTADDIPF